MKRKISFDEIENEKRIGHVVIAVLDLGYFKARSIVTEEIKEKCVEGTREVEFYSFVDMTEAQKFINGQ